MTFKCSRLINGKIILIEIANCVKKNFTQNIIVKLQLLIDGGILIVAIC